MAQTTAKRLLDSSSSNLTDLVDALIKLCEDKGYLCRRSGFAQTLENIEILIVQLRDRILEVGNK